MSVFLRNSKIFEKSVEIAGRFPQSFRQSSTNRWIAIRPDPWARVLPVSFFFPLSVAAIISRLARSRISDRQNRATGYRRSRTTRAPAISPPRIFILSYYLISPVTRINVSAQDPLIATIPHTFSSSHQSVAFPRLHRNITTSRQHWPKYIFRSPLSFHSIFLSRIVLFLFIYAEDVEVINFD